MKTNWAGFWTLIFLTMMVFAAGCGDKQVTPPPKPPPREALADTPDLYKAKLVVTDEALERLRGEGVPGTVVDALAALKGKEFNNAKDFLNAATEAVGAAAMTTHQEAILRNSASIELASEPAFPGESLQLGQKGQMEQKGEMGQMDGFKAVYFDFDRFEIKPEFMEVIKGNAKLLIDSPDLKVVLEGHCDERGTTEYNLALGEKRARAVERALVEQGVNADQLSIVSYGEERPAEPGHDEAAWAKNRRTVFTKK